MPESLLEVPSPSPAPLDPGFRPAFLGNRRYREAVQQTGRTVRMAIALEREEGRVSRADLDLLPPGPHDADTARYVERHVKFLLWARGGWKLHVNGPESLCRMLAGTYSPTGARAFDAELMGRVYEHPFTVASCPASAVPETAEKTLPIGRHLDGCRIGFDLGASDYKLAAVRDGTPVFSTELPWNPSKQADPAYHYDHIVKGLRLAASHLPRVDAIGGSSAGIIVSNRVRVASLFRAVPPEPFDRHIKPLFERIQQEFGVPLVVINDGDVTALAGAMSLNTPAILGIAMGSSQAGGYLDGAGCLTGYLSELAFTPEDYNPAAARDEWSGDIGVGAQYFSQQAVAKLAPAAGIPFADSVPLPERLKQVQERADRGEAAAEDIFRTIGVYLACSIPHYAEYYDFRHLLVLGRVTSGRGGEILLQTAREVLHRDYPETERQIAVHVPDEKSRRVGQAVAAASLPAIA